MSRKSYPEPAILSSSLRSRTGHTLEEWIAFIRETGCAKSRDIIDLLRTKYNVPEAFADMIAAASLKSPSSDMDDRLTEMYSGSRAGLRPLHDALDAKIRGLGGDVQLVPSKLSIGYRRHKRFVAIGPANSTELLFQMNLAGAQPTPRLKRSKGYTALFTHCVRLSSPKDIDAELMSWLRSAYTQA